MTVVSPPGGCDVASPAMAIDRRAVAPFGMLALLVGCARQPAVSADGLPLRRVVIYRNGVGYFERAGRVDEAEVRFRVKETEVGDFLATLAVSESGGSSVRSVAFPLKVDDDEASKSKKTDDDKRGLKQVVLSLDGREHELEVGYVSEAPVWRPSYRLVVEKNGVGYLQAWGVVQNLSGEDWKDVRLSLVAGAPLAFQAQLGEAIVPERPIVTDQGEVIAAVPRGDTSLAQVEEPATAPAPAPEVPADGEAYEAPKSAPAGKGRATKPSARMPAKDTNELKKQDRARGPSASARSESDAPASVPPPPPPAPRPKTQVVRSLRSLAAVAVETGTTRYDLPQPVTIPDKSATMVLLLSRRVPGEALFLFAPDGGVPDSASHPFRIVRFLNNTPGVLERGPIAVFEQGAFLGQGMVDPLPAAATATVPFALERALAVDSERKSDELGERVAKIENGELTIERDGVFQTKYRLRNGGDADAKLLLRHPRQHGSRLHHPPAETEDNVGTGTALVPAKIKAHATAELVVDERTTRQRQEDWFSVIAGHAVQAYLADSRAEKAVVAKLTPAWALRGEIVSHYEARAKLAQEQTTLSQQTQETRANLRAIEKNPTAAALRAKLTARLAETSTRIDEVSKRIVEIDAKLAEKRIQFKELLRDIRVLAPLPPK